MNGKIIVGKKIITKKGWVDYQGHPRLEKPMIYFSHGSTTFQTSKLKKKLKEFIDLGKTYVFQGVILNPEMYTELNKFKTDKSEKYIGNDGTETHFDIIMLDLNITYFTALVNNLNTRNINHLLYDLGKQEHVHIPGIFSWPTMFVVEKEHYEDLVSEVNKVGKNYKQLKNIEDMWDYQIQEHQMPGIDIIKNANIQPLVLDPTSKLEVDGETIQALSNVLFQYVGKRK